MCGLLDRLRRGIRAAESDVFGQGARKEEDILFDGRDLGAQRFHVPIAHIDIIDQDTAVPGIKNAVDQARERRFARSCLPDDGDCFPWLAL